MFVSGKQVSITDTYKCKEGGNFMFNQVFKIFETIKTLSMSNIIKLPDHLCFHAGHCPKVYKLNVRGFCGLIIRHCTVMVISMAVFL